MEENKSHEQSVLWEFITSFFFSTNAHQNVLILAPKHLKSVSSLHTNPILAVLSQILTTSRPHFLIRFIYVYSPTWAFILCFVFLEGFGVQEFKSCGGVSFP